MMMISVPLRFRLAVSVLLLSIPMIAAEIVVANRAPWWRLPYRNMGYWALAFGLISVPLTSWLLAGKKWAFSASTALASTWILMSAIAAIRMKHPSLGFFTLFLMIYFAAALFWIKLEMSKSFFDPRLTWYQGLPKPIPGLKCQMSAGEKLVDLRVSRIDKDGVFVFSQNERGKSSPVLPSLLEKKKLDLVFQFRDRQITCHGKPTLSISKGAGAGIQFLDVSADLKKDIGDFVEVLRGEGYV